MFVSLTKLTYRRLFTDYLVTSLGRLYSFIVSLSSIKNKNKTTHYHGKENKAS